MTSAGRALFEKRAAHAAFAMRRLLQRGDAGARRRMRSAAFGTALGESALLPTPLSVLREGWPRLTDFGVFRVL